MKIIQISDIHLQPPGEQKLGLDPLTRLDAVLAHVTRHHGDAELVVFSGDLADHGSPAAYAALRERVISLKCPQRFLLGNHDRREAFRAAFPEAQCDEHGFIQSALDATDSNVRLIFLDTHEPGWVGGRLCERRLEWLGRKLAEVEGGPVVVFMHHPPMRTAVPHFERICLADPNQFFESFRARGAVLRHVFFGHLHLAVFGTIAEGIPFAAAPPVSQGLSLTLDDSAADWVHSPPGYLVVRLMGSEVFAYPAVAAELEHIGRPPRRTGP